MVPKLSAAITAALSLNMPQISGRFFGQTPEGDLCGCAVGQALIAVGIVPREKALELVHEFECAHPLNNHVIQNFVPKEWRGTSSEPGELTPMSIAGRYNDGWNLDDRRRLVPPIGLAEIAAKLAAMGE